MTSLASAGTHGRGWRVIPGVVGGCALVLVAGFFLKTLCLPQNAGSYPSLCYSDITALYESRALDDGAIPYLDFPPGGSYVDRGFFEYPVATGLAAVVTSGLAATEEAFFAWNALALATLAVITAVILAKLVGLRAILWSAAPALGLYAFNNWDLIAVACVVLGLLMASRGRPGWAGVWFGVGTAAKLFPVLFVAPLVLERLWHRDRPGAIRAAVGATTVVVLPNALVAALNFEGWRATYSFHAARGADIGSAWALILPAATPGAVVNLLSAMLLFAAAAGIFAIGWWRASREGAYPFLPVASALLAVFLTSSKVASPQQALWLLPSLVLLPIALRWWIAWNASAVIAYGAAFGIGLLWYAPELAPDGLRVAALVRTVVLVALAFAFLWPRRAVGAPSSLTAGGRRRIRPWMTAIARARCRLEPATARAQGPYQ